MEFPTQRVLYPEFLQHTAWNSPEYPHDYRQCLSALPGTATAPHQIPAHLTRALQTQPEDPVQGAKQWDWTGRTPPRGWTRVQRGEGFGFGGGVQGDTGALGEGWGPPVSTFSHLRCHECLATHPLPPAKAVHSRGGLRGPKRGQGAHWLGRRESEKTSWRRLECWVDWSWREGCERCFRLGAQLG